ncbi:MAG: hypothetical protein U9P14_11085 [Gemmatimonadota bacterium]|nr:hypothetical protein [Gemmatimonadota bacterium]
MKTRPGPAALILIVAVMLVVTGLTSISPADEPTGITRTLMMKAWTRGREKSLIIIEKPPREAGIATLRVNENLWKSTGNGGGGSMQ